MLKVVREQETETDAEARALLVGLARGAFGAIEPSQLADHVLALTVDAEWPVRRAALLALARRFRFAVRDELRVCERPAGGAVLGAYRTESAALPGGKRSRGKARRPYLTELSSRSPLVMSCSCADFVRSSLGLCKHGLTVLRELAERKERPRATSAPERDRPRLRWDPVHPLTGSADRLARVYSEAHGRARMKAGTALLSDADKRKALRSPEARRDFVAKLEQLLEGGTLTSEPAVTTLLREERERVERQLACKARKKDALKQLKSLKRTLYPYQREGVTRFLERGRLLLADDMGLGKTTQAVAAAHALFASGTVRRGLLIVPNSLKLQWKREWEATTDAPIVLVEGQPGERKRLYRSTEQGFLLMAYEQLVRDLEEVQRFAPELVVLDEAQRIKNWATKSASYVKTLQPRYRLVLTGTPMENRLEELASIMDFVDDLALEPKWRLVPLHLLHDEHGQRSKGGAKNLNLLRGRLSDNMLRRLRSEVLTQLPPRTDTRLPIELTEVQREAHDELRRPIAELVSTASRRPLRPPEFLRLMQLLMRQRMISNGMAQVEFDEHWERIAPLSPTPALLEGLFAPKLSAFRALIEQVVLGQGRKAVVFSQWRNMLKLAAWSVRDLLSVAGMRALFFTGAESVREREAAVLAFHEDPQATVLLLSDAGGVGLNLQRAASVCVNLELPWNPAVLEQRIGRVYRLGQPAPVDIYNLVTEAGIETRIAELVAQKSALFRSLFDGTSDEIQFEGQSSFVAKVQQLVELPAPINGVESSPEPDEDEGDLASAPAPAPLELAPDPGELTRPVVAGEPCVAPDPTAGAARAKAPPPAPSTAPARPGLTVTRGADGSVRIEAPPALAQPLADLLDSLAHALRAGSGAEPQG